MRNILLIQPGAFGDIFITAPIAKWYADGGYEVVWPVRQQFYSHVCRLGYVTPVLLDDRILHSDWLRSDVIKCIEMHNKAPFDYVLNLADRGPHPTAQMPSENFEQTKYRLSSVPFDEKHKFVWDRDEVKETYLYDLVVPVSCRENYAFVHNNTSKGQEKVFSLPDISLPIVTSEEISGYEIMDWYKVITGASEIYVTVSSVFAFCDGIVKDISDTRFLLPRDTGYAGFNDTISEYWNKRYIDGY